jgi:uncharacterized protein (UPF0332 family)
MYEEKVKTTIDQAEELFDAAKEALCKPEEDVVPYMVCSNAYKSINKYLTAYLFEKEINFDMSKPAEDMLDYCQKVDSRFESLDLRKLVKPGDSEEVWMNMDVANDYMQLAEKIRDLVGVTR